MNWMVPNSKPGWWTGWMLIGFAACYVVARLIVGLLHGGESSTWHPVLMAVELTGTLCIVGSFAAGVTALAHRDRSAPVWVALVIGVLLMVGIVAPA